MDINFRRKAGGISLEAALVMPVILLVTGIMIIQIICFETEIKIKGALDRTAAEISLLSPACQLLEQIDLLGGGPQQTSELDKIINEISPGSSVESILGDALFDVISSEILGQLIQKRLDFWLAEAWSGQPGWTNQLGSRKIFLDWNLDGQQLWLCLSYELVTPIGTTHRQANAVVPLWIGKDSTESETDKDGIWLLDNFSRGKKFRALYGANLPYDFPVIARFSNGEALSIKSVDFTAPTYVEAAAIRDLITTEINRLAGFTGADYERTAQTIHIRLDEIKSRRLLLIIPDNCKTENLTALLTEMGEQAAQCDVDLEIVRHGSSYRYQSQPNTPE